MLNKELIKAIKTAQRKLGISDENYRDMLSGFGVATCKDLTEDGAKKLLKVLNSLGFKNKIKGKYDHLKNRSSEYASPAQLEMLELLWVRYSRTKTEASFREFIRKIVKVERIEWLLKEHVKKVKSAIEHL